MHVYFSGIGGVGIGPLALIAKQAGYEVSGSDIKDGQNLAYLKEFGINELHIGQTKEQIAELHAKKPIDWLVYSSALPKTDPHHPELEFVKENNIRSSKRDELLNEILSQKNLKLIAIAGTHGKTTTTAMVIWLFKELGIPVSYSLGAKISFGDMGHYEPGSEYFVYECDEFDRNFLSFKPNLSIIPGIAWDHHEIYPTQESYYDAFKQFIAQSKHTFMWYGDQKKLNLFEPSKNGNVIISEQEEDPEIPNIKLAGLYNRRNAWLAVRSLEAELRLFYQDLIKFVNQFPGVSRRFERIKENLYTDDAHTPEKILGCMSVAGEISSKNGQKIVVIYEPLTNRRMHYTATQHRDVFEGAAAIYWLPSYLAREDPAQPILSPAELIKNLNPDLQAVAKPMEKDEQLKKAINEHLQKGDLVVAMTGGGAGSLDEWLRRTFAPH